MNAAAPSTPWAVILFVQLPLVTVWLLVLWDITRQSSLSLGKKLLWASACTILWPTQVLYILVRPQRGLGERHKSARDAQGRLVNAMLDHDSGRIDDEAFVDVKSELRRSAHHK